MGFRLVPKSVTVNDLERCNGVISANSEFRYLSGALRKSSRLLSHLLMSSCVYIVVVAELVEVGLVINRSWVHPCVKQLVVVTIYTACPSPTNCPVS